MPTSPPHPPPSGFSWRRGPVVLIATSALVAALLGMAALLGAASTQARPLDRVLVPSPSAPFISGDHDHGR